MNMGIYYQMLAGFTREQSRFAYPKELKDILRALDIQDVRQLEEFFADELMNTSMHDDNGAEYFVFLSESALLFAMCRRNFAEFDRIYEIVNKRLESLKASGVSQIDVQGWLWYFKYLAGGAARLMRKASIEAFEKEIDDIEWDAIGSEFIYRVSTITGFVYLNETNPEKRSKARFWLQKAVSEQEISRTLVAFLHLADFYLTETKGDYPKRLQDHLSRLEGLANDATDPGLSKIFRTAVAEYQARALVARSSGHGDDIALLEKNVRKIREVENDLTNDGATMPGFAKASLKALCGNYYFRQCSSELDQEDYEDLMALAFHSLNEGIVIARNIKDEPLRFQFRLDWMTFSATKQTKVAEKDVREILAEAKKGDDHVAYVRSCWSMADYLLVKHEPQKAYDLLLEMVRKGSKKLTEGGFFLVSNGFQKINDIFLIEVERPGISWIVTSLPAFFASVSEMVDGMENYIPAAGQEMFDRFLEEFIRLEPATHFNLKVYLRYQYYEMKMLRLAAIAREDSLAQRLAETLIHEISQENNPLTFIQSNWEEFKDVPNSVRNKVLNKCISISKGDLPMAADHIDFSYRNLRSYITFKEVNRLGFFMDKQETNNRQLENGIRYLFYDLYKRGTIFEVVFDMPKFLVLHSKNGFSSQDLEEALDIKGTTAKKYIKIMMEMGMVKMDHSKGRKHFYRLRKDVVMNRVGKEASVAP
ncbi:MAG: hypothetical protein RLZZ165_970 [Bacteroidota bacterium]